MEDIADDARFHRYYILTFFLRDCVEPDRLLHHRAMQDLRILRSLAHFISTEKWDEPFSKKEAQMMVVALSSSLEDVERETIRRMLAEVTNHREQPVKLFYVRLRTLHLLRFLTPSKRRSLPDSESCSTMRSGLGAQHEIISRPA